MDQNNKSLFDIHTILLTDLSNSYLRDKWPKTISSVDIEFPVDDRPSILRLSSSSPNDPMHGNLCNIKALQGLLGCFGVTQEIIAWAASAHLTTNHF
jgi:hypothetical protein